MQGLLWAVDIIILMVNNFYAFMKQYSFLCSQKFAAGSILSQFNSHHILTTCFSKINFNFNQVGLSFEVINQNFACIASFPIHVTHIAHTNFLGVITLKMATDVLEKHHVSDSQTIFCRTTQ
jgi:hypothetical protein